MGFGQAGSRDHEEAALTEVSKWPGASIRFEPGNKHAIGYLTFGGKTQKTFYPCTSSDLRGPLNFASNIRHMLIEMGAQKPRKRLSEEMGSEKPKKKLRQHAKSISKPIPRDTQDRWLGPLKALKEAMEKQT